MNIFEHNLFGTENGFLEVKINWSWVIKNLMALDTHGQMIFQKGFANVPSSQLYRVSVSLLFGE